MCASDCAKLGCQYISSRIGILHCEKVVVINSHFFDQTAISVLASSDVS